MSKSTIVELVAELEKRNAKGRYDKIIAEAKAGEYHDFKNTKYAAPKVELVSKLSKFPELDDLANDVMDGVYDEDYRD